MLPGLANSPRLSTRVKPRADVNFVMGEGVNAAYPEATWKRLVQIKQKYDPSNLFYMNHNIPPELETA